MNWYFVAVFTILNISAFFIWIAWFRKKFIEYSSKLEKKKGEIDKVYANAEEMIDELTRFSDYLFTKIDLKNKEVWSSLKKYEERLNSLDEKAHQIIKSYTSIPNPTDIQPNNRNIKEKPFITKPFNETTKEDSFKNVIPINTKYREVFDLAEDGYSSTEIAQKLNMGKGEIQLVLELTK